MADVLKTTVRKGAEGAIRERKVFAAGSMSGRWVHQGEFISMGQLPGILNNHLNVTIEESDVYVVFSYDTPIAWLSESEGIRIPDAKYSVTTSKHQAIARRALVN